jgi:hypothetical protein
LISAAEGDRVDVGRVFPVTQHQDRRPEMSEDHSKIVVLSTYDDTHDAVLACGEMLSAVLLDATMAGLGTCTLTHITELPASRSVVASLIGQPTTPQVLIRIGLAPSIDAVPPVTPRRPIDEVLEFARGTYDGTVGTFASADGGAPSIASETTQNRRSQR